MPENFVGVERECFAVDNGEAGEPIYMYIYTNRAGN